MTRKRAYIPPISQTDSNSQNISSIPPAPVIIYSGSIDTIDSSTGTETILANNANTGEFLSEQTDSGMIEAERIITNNTLTFVTEEQKAYWTSLESKMADLSERIANVSAPADVSYSIANGSIATKHI